jgi:DNA-binding transcriptional regulator YdaS (Cro superfamily)
MGKPTENYLSRLVAGAGARRALPTDNAGMVRELEKDLGLVGDKGSARKLADVLGVHPDTVRRWKRGARPTPNADLRAVMRRSKLSPKREAKIRNGEFTMRATVRASNKKHTQNMNLGSVLEGFGRNVGDELADAWLEGENLGEVLADLVDEYSGGIGMEIVDIESLEI